MLNNGYKHVYKYNEYDDVEYNEYDDIIDLLHSSRMAYLRQWTEMVLRDEQLCNDEAYYGDRSYDSDDDGDDNFDWYCCWWWW